LVTRLFFFPFKGPFDPALAYPAWIPNILFSVLPHIFVHHFQ
jgi:hypothetical protein